MKTLVAFLVAGILFASSATFARSYNSNRNRNNNSGYGVNGNNSEDGNQFNATANAYMLQSEQIKKQREDIYRRQQVIKQEKEKKEKAEAAKENLMDDLLRELELQAPKQPKAPVKKAPKKQVDEDDED